MQLIVLGMHRSGTSVVARLLNMMGAYFGSEGISLGVQPDNPKGFWERRDVKELNDFVLHSLNCSWDKILNFKIDELTEETIAEFNKRATTILLEMDAHRPWVLKDPRMCLLFPLWRKLLEVPVCIYVYRNPLEVAKSLYKRNNIPINAGCALWEIYNTFALDASKDLPRIFVSYQDIMKDSVEVVDRIYFELVEIGVAGLRMPSKREVSAFVVRDLYHEEVNDKELENRLNSNQRKLFNFLANGKTLSENYKWQLSSEGLKYLDRYERDLRDASKSRNAVVAKEVKLGKQEKNNLKEDYNKKLIEKEKESENGFRKLLFEKEKELKEKFDSSLIKKERQLKEDFQKMLIKKEKELKVEYDKIIAKNEEEIKSAKELISNLKFDLIAYHDRNQQDQKQVKEILASQNNIIAEFIDGINELIHSRRWKIGSTLVSLIKYKLLFRTVPPLPSDYLSTVIKRYKLLEKQGRFNPEITSSEKSKYLTIGPDTKSYEESLNKVPDQLYSLDIVICVHNALEDVKECLYSLIENTPQQHRLIVVNDGSGPETTMYLRKLDEIHKHILLLENEFAQGYTKAANVGLRASNSDYVILLNSDTIVPRLWVNNLIECAESNSKIGIVGPLSNAASWQSIPKRFNDSGDWAVNELAENFDVNQMAELVYQLSEKSFPRVSFINGFCFAIKRAVIDAIGYLDEKSFPKGYGEENDYCLRAIEAGFDLAIADQGYVYHSKSKSYSHSRRLALSKEGGESLKRKHGAQIIHEGTRALKENKGLADIRHRIQLYLEGSQPACMQHKNDLRILFVMPVRGGGGGAHSVVQEVDGMRKLGVDARVATLKNYSDGFKSNYPDLFKRGEHFLFYRDEAELQNLASGFDIVVATLYSTPAMLEPIVFSNPNILTAYYIQDYEPWFFDEGTERWRIAYDSYNRISDMVLFAKTDWLCGAVSEKHGRAVHKVSPSLDHKVYYPLQTKCTEEKSIVISAMVRPSSPRRAPVNTLEVLRRVKDKYDAEVRINIFGCSMEELKILKFDKVTGSSLNFSFTNHGVLTREEVADVLRESDIFVDFSDYQAFGRTGLEAMACGCAVILPSVGGVYEYAVHEENSLIVDTSSIDAMTIALQRLVEDVALRERFQERGVKTAEKFNVERAVLSELSLFRLYKFKKCLKSFPLKVLVWPCVLGESLEPTGSAYIRLLKPLNYSTLTSKLNVQLINSFEELRQETVDICIVQRHAIKESEVAENVAQFCRANGIKLVHEIDDDLFNMQKSGHKGLPKEEYKALGIIAKSADRIVTSSPPLQEELKTINPNVVCVPNAHDENLWLKRNGKPFELQQVNIKDNIIRVLYMGTRTHLADLQVIKDAWQKIEKEYGQRVVLEIVGGAPNDQLDFGQPYGDFKKGNYLDFVNWLTAQQRWHIGVIPLADTDFNRKKSYIKFLDYSALGLASICSDIQPYREVVKNGENGLLVRNDTECWYKAIKRVIDEPKLRKKLSFNAHQDLINMYTLQHRANDFLKAYKNI